MAKKLFFFILTTFTLQSLFSQQQKVKGPDGKILTNLTIDSIAGNLMKNGGVTGLSIGVISNNKVHYIKSYGYRNKAANQLNDTNTVFYAASLSKGLFAHLVMQLVDEGVIDLDKPLYQYLPRPLPEYENYKDLSGDERWKLITARTCLNHTTGFPNWRQLNPNGSKKLQIFFNPGTRFAYSGEGFYLLQMVVETITSQGLEDLSQTHIFDPFGMSKTSFEWQRHFEKNYAVGHNKDEDTLTLIKRTEANAAGSMETTISDYTRFIACLMQGKGLSKQSKEEMLSPQIKIYTTRQFPSLNNDTTSRHEEIQLSYGLGFGLFATKYGRAFFKEGHSDDGWEHYTIGFPDSEFALVIMTNSLNGESIFKELVENTTGATIPWEWEGYTPYQPTVHVPGNILQQYIGDYGGRFSASISLKSGQLQIEAPAEGLNKTNLYPAAENRFFMKMIPVSLEFMREKSGKVERVIVNDEGEMYELNKIDSNNVLPQKTKVAPSLDILSTYVGKYLLEGTVKKTLVIKMENDHLVAQLPEQGTLELVFSSDTTFRFKSAISLAGQFIIDNKKPTKLIVEQNGRYEWRKIE